MLHIPTDPAKIIHCSVSVCSVDLYGGTFAEEGEAQFLFSDNAQAQDTVRLGNVTLEIEQKWSNPLPPPHTPHPHRVYGEQPGVGVFLSSWVLEVVHQRSHIQDVPLGRHILLPTHLHSVSSSTDITKWNSSRDHYDSRAQYGDHENGTRDGGRGGRSQKGVQRPVVWSSTQSDAEWQSLIADVKTVQLDSEW